MVRIIIISQINGTDIMHMLLPAVGEYGLAIKDYINDTARVQHVSLTSLAFNLKYLPTNKAGFTSDLRNDTL